MPSASSRATTRAAAAEAVVEAVLPRALGGGVGPAHGIERARDGPHGRIQPRLQRHLRFDHRGAARRLGDPLDVRRQPERPVEVPGQGYHQIRAIGEVEIDGLAGHAGGLCDLRHGDAGVAPPGDECQRGIQNPAGGVGT